MLKKVRAAKERPSKALAELKEEKKIGEESVRSIGSNAPNLSYKKIDTISVPKL